MSTLSINLSILDFTALTPPSLAQPKLQDFGNHRLPAVLDDLRKSTHEGITRYEQILDGGEAMMDEDGDGELLMTEEETPVIDRFSKMPLENAFMA